MNKRILIICRQAPYGSSLAREAIDLALAISIFEQKLSILFFGDGVLQLLKDQQSLALNMKNHGNVISAFPLYDINDIYIDQRALSVRKITEHDLLLTGKILSTEKIANLIDQYDVVLNF